MATDDGVVVYRMSRSGDAYSAGIRPGDVIIAFNGKAVRAGEDFERSMLNAPIGSVATLRIRRGPEEFDVKVPVAEAPLARGR